MDNGKLRRTPLKKTLLALASLTLILAGSLSFSQGEEPAEKVYKNIISFKGVPAKDLMPAMRFMNAALKVNCAYCHDEADYAKDVPNKEITRKMIDLQREINEKYFNNRLEVTCNSCHNGLTHPVAVPVIGGLSNQHTRFRTELTPADFVKKHLDAAGGGGPILRLKGTLKEGNAAATPFEVVQSPEGKFVADLDGLKMGWDGTTAWTSDGTTTTKLWGDDAVGMARMGRTYRLPAAFEGRARLTIGGQEKLGDRSTVVIRGTMAGVTEEFYFDEATGLLGRVGVYTRSSLGSAPTFVDYEDYRAVEGVKVAFRIKSLSMNGQPTVAQYESAKPEPSFDVKGFSPPEK